MFGIEVTEGGRGEVERWCVSRAVVNAAVKHEDAISWVWMLARYPSNLLSLVVLDLP